MTGWFCRLFARVSHKHAQEEIDIDAVKSVFPYGNLMPIEFQSGGMRASSGIALPEMGGEGQGCLPTGGGVSRVLAEMDGHVSVRLRVYWCFDLVGCEALQRGVGEASSLTM